jgi:hypothetical protein
VWGGVAANSLAAGLLLLVLGIRPSTPARRYISSAARFTPKSPHLPHAILWRAPPPLASLRFRSGISRSRERSRTSSRRDGPRWAPARARRRGDRSGAGESLPRSYSRRGTVLAPWRVGVVGSRSRCGGGRSEGSWFFFGWGFGHALGFGARVAVSGIANCIPSYFCVAAWRSSNLAGAVRSGCRFLVIGSNFTAWFGFYHCFVVCANSHRVLLLRGLEAYLRIGMSESDQISVQVSQLLTWMGFSDWGIRTVWVCLIGVGLIFLSSVTTFSSILVDPGGV